MRGKLLFLLDLTLAFYLSSNCSQFRNSYYDTSLMSCNSCPSLQMPSQDYSACICSPGYKKNYVGQTSAFTCSICSAGQTPDSTRTTCQSCPGVVKNNACFCSQSLDVAYEKALNQDGSIPTTKSCISCTADRFAGPGTSACENCGDINMSRNSVNYQCFCKSGYISSQDACVSSTNSANITQEFPINEAIIVMYPEMESGNGMAEVNLTDSDTFKYFYLEAAYECGKGSIVSCQQLANLCVLELYNAQSAVCQIYQSIMSTKQNSTYINDPGAKLNMPWLYYQNKTEDVLYTDKVSMLITFDPSEANKTNLLQFVLASFSLNGTFLGFQNLTDQLILCPHSYKVESYFRTFGTNVEVTCSLDLSVFIASAETKFLELYLNASDGSIIDVPVLIENYIDQNGDQPNKNSDESTWKLFRRFFIYDNVSGKEGNDAYISGATTSVLQYMQSSILKITLINDQDQKIFAPLLKLKYRSRLTSYILNTDSTDTITFSSQYTMNTSRFWSITLGVFVALNVIILIFTIIRLYIWTKSNPSAHYLHSYGSAALVQCLWLLSGTWSFIMFWFLIGITAYWFIFYKMQYHVYALVPPYDTYNYNYLPFVVVFSLVFASHFIWVAYLIYSQASFDIIFIDREQPQQSFKPGVDKITAAIYRDENNYKEYISAWRTLMVINEFAELQAHRYVYIELTLFFLLFFLKGVSWEDLARAQPDFAVNSVAITLIPINMILRFFLTSFLFLVISYIQLILRKVLSTWLPTPSQNFIDLCVVSNISVLILDDSLHGYYIHAVTPLNRADMALEELHEGLSDNKLKEGLKKSLLVPDEEDLYTFEIYIPFDMRIQYNNIMQKAQEDQEFNKKNLNILKNERTRYKLNERFKSFFDPEVKNLRSFVFEKTSLQKLLNLPPTDMSTYTGSAFFYKDPALSFERVLFLGREFSMLLMDLLVFDLLDIAVGNSLVSALTTYIFSKTVEYVRFSLGERNIARKTMIDKRFII